MDKRAQTHEQDVLDGAVEALQVPGITVRLQQREVGAAGPRQHDAMVEIRHGDRRIQYLAEVKRNLRPATLGALLQQLRALDGRPLLVADHVTTPMGERLRDAGVEFIDTAGNAWLNDPPLLLWVTGKRPETGKTPRARGRAFQAGGLRVLFALLCKPEIVDRPYREIARYAGVAHGTVGWLMAELPDLGYVAEYRRRRLLVEPERLLVNWAEAYARTLRPKCLMARYRAGNIDWWKELDAGEFGLELGGEVAAARMTKYLKPATMTLYTEEINNKFVAKFGLRKDPQGNVEILERFWNFNTDHDGMVPLPLVYADLLATGDTRCIETAEKLYERIVDGFEPTP